MTSAAAVQIDTEELCVDIERFNQQLVAGTITSLTAKQLWESYQPKARELAKRLLPYVPDGDPRLTVHSRVRDSRVVTADVLTGIDEPLSDELELASAHLCFVVEQLRELLNYCR
jgi:hypothetical protein